jgi:GPH family glycoside/pentoside/hexuronide:cation symporter
VNTKNIRLSIKEKIGYGLGDTACHFSWDLAGMFLFFYYTDVYGISAAAAGTIMMIARIWDAISDPLIGIISDRTKTKYGKFRPYMVWFALPLSLSLIMLFTTPDFEGTAKIIYAAGAYLLLSTFYTAVNLPFSALSGVMTSDSGERTLLNQYRFFLGFIGMFIVSFTMYFKNFLIRGDVSKYAESIGIGSEGMEAISNYNWAEAVMMDTTGTLKSMITQYEQGAFQLIAIVLGAVGFILLLYSYFSTKERIEPPANQKSDLRKDLKNVFGLRPWFILFVLGIITFVLILLQGAVINQYFKYFIKSENDATILYSATTVSLIVGVLLARPLTKRFEKRNVYLVCSAIAGVLTMALYIPGPDDFYLLHTINILSKLAIAPTIPLLWAMIADTADYSEWKNKRRATGLFFSATTFAQKLGGGIATGLAGLILTMVNYDGNLVEQNDEAVLSLRLLFSIVPGILYLVTALLLLGYKLDDNMLESIKLDLEKRRAEENNKQ